MLVPKLRITYNFLLIIIFFSILNNGIFEFVGIRLYLIISLIAFIKFNPNLSYLNNILTHELIYFGIIYFLIIIFIPYHDSHDAQRTFFQKFDGRYLSQMVRFLLEIITSIVLYKLYTYNKESFLKSLMFATNLTIILALFDYFLFNKFLYSQFLGNTHVGNRFTGLNIEPRMFGIILTYVYVFFKLHLVSNKKLILIILSIFLTLSVSSIIIFILSYLYLNRRNVSLILSSVSFFILILFLFIIPHLDEFQLIIDRLMFLSTIKGGSDYFSIFSIAEVFDRAALNALFNNRIYLFTGFGPNTISIPSSDYIPIELANTYDGIINSVPHTGLVNILSRSGLFFLIYYLSNFYKKDNKIFFWIYLLQANFIFYSFYLILFSKKDVK